jgi:hypothetical protein
MTSQLTCALIRKNTGMILTTLRGYRHFFWRFLKTAARDSTAFVPRRIKPRGALRTYFPPGGSDISQRLVFLRGHRAIYWGYFEPRWRNSPFWRGVGPNRAPPQNAHKEGGALRKELAAINGAEDGMEKGMEEGTGDAMENGMENKVENGIGNGTVNG